MKTFIFILLILLPFGLFGQIKVHGFIEGGYFNEKICMNKNMVVTEYYNPNVFYADITLNLTLKGVHFEQQLFNVFGYNSGKTFSVISITYKTRLYYEWESLAIGVEHMCLHPIIQQHNELAEVTLRSSHDKIFLRYTFNNAN